MGDRRWADALPPPVTFVLSGGASLGAIHVGMLQALVAVSLHPDRLVATSVGALNAAIVADAPDLATGAARLERLWRRLRTTDVFRGRLVVQLARAWRSGALYDSTRLRALIRSSVAVQRLEHLRVPLAVVTVDLLSGHPAVWRRGPLAEILLATTAIPGVLPPVELDGRPHWDGSIATSVPVLQARDLGAGSLVVLDATDLCHRTAAPRTLPDSVLLATATALRQRVAIEAPLVARDLPVVYLPRPCTDGRAPLDLDSSWMLIAPAREAAAAFLASTPPPAPGRMAGMPHAHAVAA